VPGEEAVANEVLEQGELRFVVDVRCDDAYRLDEVRPEGDGIVVEEVE
jgi:hypothetical protein